MPGTLWIASSDLLGVQPDGSKVRMVARLGSPARRADGTWTSAYAVEGLAGTREMTGADSLQALSMAMSMVRALLERYLEQGGRLLDPDTLEDFPLEAAFGLVGGRGLDADELVA